MAIGLLFPILLAILILPKKQEQILTSWGLTRTITLALLLGLIILSYIDIEIGSIYLNLGGVFLLVISLWLLRKSTWSQKFRIIAIALITATLIFFAQNGLLWQLEQYLPYVDYLVIAITVLFLALSGGYRGSFIAAALGVEIAGFVSLILTGSGMGISYLNIFFITLSSTWGLLWLVRNFQRKQLTNAKE